MATYATEADFEAYTGTDVPPADGPALERRLQQAERDIDALFVGAPSRTTGLKLDTSSWQAWEREALARAVAAQAEWIAARPRPGDQPDRVVKSEEGPEFKRTWETGPAATQAPAAAGGRYNPAIATELATIQHRQVTGARARP